MFKIIINRFWNKKKNLMISDYNSLPANLYEEFNMHRPTGPKPKLCYAPFTNIFFHSTGRVSVCCQSMDYYEMIQEKTIRQIWEGQKFTKLREYIKHNDLNLACLNCLSHIVNKNYFLAQIKMFDDLTEINPYYPSCMEFELENTCNLECIMCMGNQSSLIRKNRENLPPLEKIYDDKFVEQLDEFIPHLKKMRFVGGEPFMIESYYKIWEKAISINPSIILSVSTNGTVLPARAKELMGKGRFEIILSLDSLNKETYEKIRINANFEKMMQNLNYFSNYCKEKNTHFNIDPCPLRINRKEMPEFVTFCNSLGVQLFYNTVISPAEHAIWSLSSNELETIYNEYSTYDFPENNLLEKNNRNQFNDLKNQVKAWQNKAKAWEDKISVIISAGNKTIFLQKLENYINSDNELSHGEKIIKLEFYRNILKEISLNKPEDINEEYLYYLVNQNDIQTILETLKSNGIDMLLKKVKSLYYRKYEV
jgi:molybdenum cofactor biosynthesis enzyme MoaA